MDMGIFAQFSIPRLTDTIMLLREKTARAGKRLGIFAGNFDAARNWYAKGFDMCIINSELALLSSAVAGEVGKRRSELEAGKCNGSSPPTTVSPWCAGGRRSW